MNNIARLNKANAVPIVCQPNRTSNSPPNDGSRQHEPDGGAEGLNEAADDEQFDGAGKGA